MGMGDDYLDNEDPSPVLDRLRDRLEVYVGGQHSSVRAFRTQEQPDHPWPAQTNVMLEYLVHRTVEILETGDTQGAVLWLAAHAWFEGSLDGKEHVMRDILRATATATEGD